MPIYTLSILYFIIVCTHNCVVNCLNNLSDIIDDDDDDDFLVFDVYVSSCVKSLSCVT